MEAFLIYELLNGKAMCIGITGVESTINVSLQKITIWGLFGNTSY